MASVHRDPKGRSPYWYAAFTLQDGTRCFRSTKLKDRSSALKLAMEWEHLGRTVAERDPVGVQISRVNQGIRNSGFDCRHETAAPILKFAERSRQETINFRHRLSRIL
jgi:hypothetical protein